MNLINWFNNFIDLLFPRCCVVCNEVLSHNEQYICLSCLSYLPKTNCHLQEDNEIEKRFWGKVNIEKATSYFFYEKGGGFHNILYELKYHNCKHIGYVMGTYIVMDLQSSDFFNNIDLLIPIPLHRKKEKKRGYNQSEWIAKGISQITGIPVRSDIIKRIIDNPTQTKKSSFERWENVEGIFGLEQMPDLENKHILLVDDVLTTGATIASCAIALTGSGKVKVSVLTLAAAF